MATKKELKNRARQFAADIVENTEIMFAMDDLDEKEHAIVEKEMKKIVARIKSTIRD